MSASSCPPVLVLAFNRPEPTRRVLEVLKVVRPAVVYFAVDGARPGKEREVDAVRAVHDLTAAMDWGCEVRTLFRDRNLGCKLAVSEAVTWFFSQVDAGIILEDDCVAHPSFFRFAAELLERYREDERILMISGDNFQQGRKRAPYSYYFSRYTHIWGWASWRRAWKLYDHSMSAWPELRRGDWLMDVLRDRRAVEYWKRVFDETHAERNTSWAYRWMFTAWSQSCLTILPNSNLVSNIGFGEMATHTRHQDASMSALPYVEMQFPLHHPPYVIRDARSDTSTQRSMFSAPGLLRRIASRAKRSLMSSKPTQ